MRTLARTVSAALGASALLVFFVPGVASADNCGSLSDCYGTARAGLAALAGLAILAGVLLSIALDLTPGVGTVKGVIEGVTGKDLITGQELAWWERALGLVPVVGVVAGLAGVATVLAKGAGALEDIADVGRGVDRAADAARAAERAADVIQRDSRGRIIPPGVQRLPSGKLPPNFEYAGRVYDGPQWTSELQARYPDGVRIKENGFPDFTPYAVRAAKFDPPGYKGNYGSDFKVAAEKVGLSSTDEIFETHTWHHHEDGHTMELIPYDLHDAVRHAAGMALKKGS